MCCVDPHLHGVHLIFHYLVVTIQPEQLFVPYSYGMSGTLAILGGLALGAV